MNILASSFTLQHNSLDIYVAGCGGFPHCANCHNPESWDFHQGEKYDEQYWIKLKNKIVEFDTIIHNIMIFGGEPLDQNKDELLHMLFDLKTLGKKVWLFTRYEIAEIPNHIRQMCDYIKTGKYIPELIVDGNICYGIKLATSNQKIWMRGVDY
jgi:organic radical activating enzyme